jgi:hypothetical protein
LLLSRATVGISGSRRRDDRRFVRTIVDYRAPDWQSRVPGDCGRIAPPHEGVVSGIDR